MFASQRASNVTSAQLIECKFLKLISFVLAILVAFVVLFPIVWVTVSIPVIFHPVNVYHVLLGLFTVNGVSYMAVFGCCHTNAHVFNIYLILYIFASHTALYVLFPVLWAGIFTHLVGVVVPSHVHHKNVYPVLVGSCNVMAPLSYVYLLGLAGLFSHPSNS